MVGNMEFSGLQTRRFGAVVTDYSGASAPEREYTAVEVPGRNGDLTVDGGRYRNIDVSYALFFVDRRAFCEYRNRLIQLRGYQKLMCSFEPGEYRLARIKGMAEAGMVGMHARHATLNVTFTCKPQRFLTDGERPREFTKTDTSALWNPTGTEAAPLIRVYGTGALGVGSCSITIAEHEKAYVDIDSDTQDCYCGTANLNGYITLTGMTFPTLGEGTTGIELGEGITKAIVWPRWWRL